MKANSIDQFVQNNLSPGAFIQMSHLSHGSQMRVLYS